MMVPEFPVDATFETFQPTAEEKKGWGPAAMREKWVGSEAARDVPHRGWYDYMRLTPWATIKLKKNNSVANQIKAIREKLEAESGYPYPEDAQVDSVTAYTYGLVIGTLMTLEQEWRNNVK